MTTLNLSTAFDTTTFVDPTLILDALFRASRDGAFIIEDIPYDDGVSSYRCTMKESFGKEDEAVTVYKITNGDIDINAPFAAKCIIHTHRLEKLIKIGAPKIVIENERFFLTVARILNAYVDEVEELSNGRGMDKLTFELMSPYKESEHWATQYNYTDTPGTRILVNGNDLVDLVNEAMGETRHGHMEPRMVYYELKCAEVNIRHDDEAHIGLCNDCGDMGCDPILCLVYTDQDLVTWIVGNFEFPEMFKFFFDCDEYDTAVSELRRLGLEHGEAAKPENLSRDVDLYYEVEQFGTLADYLYMRGYSDEAVEASRVCDKTCCFTGHRPKSFAQFCNNGKDMPEGLSKWLDEKIDYVVREHGVRRFVCGNAEGVDTWAAKAVLRYRETHPDIRLEIAVPFEGHNAHIPEIAEIQRQADEVRIVSKNKNHTEAYHKRNKYMVNKSDVVLGVCIFYVNEAKGIRDMQKGGTRRTLTYARCLDKKVYVKKYYKQIDPK